MANFVSRNVLICVVPAVVVLLSLYWFKKKKKMKPDISAPVNANNSSVNKSSEAFDSGESIYSPVESISDFSNTLSDASSISSPESSQRTQSISAKASSKNVVDNCIEAHTVSNHISQLKYQDIISITTENIIDNTNSPIQTTLKSDNSNQGLKHLSSKYEKVKESNDSQPHIEENIDVSIHNLSTSFNDALDKCLSENEQISKVANDNFILNSNLLSINKIEKKLISDVSKDAITEVSEEPVIAVKQNIFASELFNRQSETKPLDDPNIALESDSHDSHSSVLDENSLSSVSDDSEKHTDFKYKDSPSSVFDGNSISDESEKTDISNERVDHLKCNENYKDNQEFVHNDAVATNCHDPNDEKYSIQLNKNSFFKTILPGNTTDEISSSSLKKVNSSSLQHCIPQTPDNHQSHSSEESFVTVSNDDEGCTDQFNNQPILLNNETDSTENNSSISSTEASLTNEIMLLSPKNGIYISDVSCNQNIEQSEIIEPLSCDIVSSTNDVIHKGDSTKVNGSESDSTLCTETDAVSETVKLQHNVLQPSQNKAADLDVIDVKDSGVTPGLHVYEFDLPQELCGRLIGKQGKHVKSIKERTNANVFIKRHPYDSNLKTVVVEGSRVAVHEALEIIRRKFPPSQFPAVTLIQTNMNTHGVSLPDSLQLHLPEGASCDVILSSLVSAGHFFLQQPTHPTYPSLSTLDQCMINCYMQMNTPMLPTPVEAGVICAAPVMNGWFRAQIIYVYENRAECEIKFVDYGGFSQVPIASLRQIRSDFMTLPFQASECYLANVRPVDRNAGWSSEATSVFEELAQGQILQALLIDYAEDGIPYVHLYRVQGVSNMFINRELVERGLAVWVDSSHWDPH